MILPNGESHPFAQTPVLLHRSGAVHCQEFEPTHLAAEDVDASIARKCFKVWPSGVRKANSVLERQSSEIKMVRDQDISTPSFYSSNKFLWRVNLNWLINFGLK